jgi:hypothetical protein
MPRRGPVFVPEFSAFDLVDAEERDGMAIHTLRALVEREQREGVKAQLQRALELAEIGAGLG